MTMRRSDWQICLQESVTQTLQNMIHVDVPASKMKIAIANILLDEGYIAKYDLVEDGHFQTIHITLKYGVDKNEKVISGLKRISKPGLRVYANTENIPKVLGGLGTAIPFYKQRCCNRQRGKKTRRRRRGSLLRFGDLNPLSTEETPSPLNSWETSLSVEVYFRTKLESTSLSAQCN